MEYRFQQPAGAYYPPQYRHSGGYSEPQAKGIHEWLGLKDAPNEQITPAQFQTDFYKPQSSEMPFPGQFYQPQMAEPHSGMNQTMISTGLESLYGTDRLVIKQKKEILEIFTDWEANNRYEIYNEAGQLIFYAFEDSSCLSRCFLGRNRPFCIRVVDLTGRREVNDEYFRVQNYCSVWKIDMYSMWRGGLLLLSFALCSV